MDRETYLVYIKEYQNKRRIERRNYCIEKLGGKCAKCGSVENLQFDHIVPFGTTMAHGYRISELLTCSKERLDTQLEKCQLLCDKCHAEKTNYIDRVHHSTIHGTHGALKYCKPRCDKCREFEKRYNANRPERRK